VLKARAARAQQAYIIHIRIIGGGFVAVTFDSGMSGGARQQGAVARGPCACATVLNSAARTPRHVWREERRGARPTADDGAVVGGGVLLQS
jgi:hypothetical protein